MERTVMWRRRLTILPRAVFRVKDDKRKRGIDRPQSVAVPVELRLQELSYRC
jgi:hypothetical protein